MEAAHEYRIMLACDIAALPGRTAEDLQSIRQLVEAALRGAFYAGGLEWNRCLRRDTGDGFHLAVPPDFRKLTIIDRVLPALASFLRSYNEWAAENLRIRLRVALHVDEIHSDTHHSAANAPFGVLLCLLNAASLRAAMADAPDNVPIVAILSQSYGEELVGCDHYGSRADTFIPVEVREQDCMGRAWIHYPGSPGASAGREPHIACDQ